MAQTLARAGLHLGATTIGRMFHEVSPLPNHPDGDVHGTKKASSSLVTAKHKDHVWQVDLTVVPTRLGFWVPWFPYSQLQVWPFCWWVAVVKDVFTRQIVGMRAFSKQPTFVGVRQFLGSLMSRSLRKPKYIITDKGGQFWNPGFKDWCRRKEIQPRYGAIGQYGSIAGVERLILSLKNEHLRIIQVPLFRREMERALVIYQQWFNEHRPHQGLAGLTPDEASQTATTRDLTRFEPRILYPMDPNVSLRGEQGDKFDLSVIPFEENLHLPIIELKTAA